MDIDRFSQWLSAYGEAWTRGDPDAIVPLYSPTAAYYEVPFGEPMRGAQAIRQYWTDGAKNAQQDVTFSATAVAFDGREGYARWSATFRRVPSGVRVQLDGVLYARFDEAMRCEEFREWWHRLEE